MATPTDRSVLFDRQECLSSWMGGNAGRGSDGSDGSVGSDRCCLASIERTFGPSDEIADGTRSVPATLGVGIPRA